MCKHCDNCKNCEDYKFHSNLLKKYERISKKVNIENKNYITKKLENNKVNGPLHKCLCDLTRNTTCFDIRYALTGDKVYLKIKHCEDALDTTADLLITRNPPTAPVERNLFERNLFPYWTTLIFFFDRLNKLLNEIENDRLETKFRSSSL